MSYISFILSGNSLSSTDHFLIKLFLKWITEYFKKRIRLEKETNGWTGIHAIYNLFYSRKVLLHVFIADFHDIDSSNFYNRDCLQNEPSWVSNNTLNHIKI